MINYTSNASVPRIFCAGIAFVIASFLYFETPPMHGQTAPQLSSLTPERKRLRIDCFPVIIKGAMPESQRVGTPAILEFEAISYNPPLKLEKTTEKEWDLSSPESAVRGFQTAARAGNLDWMIKTWVPADRGGFKADFDQDKKKLERETAYYQSMLADYITDIYIYGDYRILAVMSKFKDGSWHGFPAVYKKTNTGWLRSNDLHTDYIAYRLIGHIFSRQKEVKESVQ
jgi:hypothetical protein